MDRYLIGTAPSGRGAIFGFPPAETIGLIALIHIGVGSSFPYLYLSVREGQLFLDRELPVIVNQGTAGVRPLAEINHRLLHTILTDKPTDTHLAYRVGNAHKHTVLAIAPYPRQSAITKGHREEVGEQFAILIATEQIAPCTNLISFRVTFIYPFRTGASKAAVEQPARIAFDRNKRGNHIGSAEESHTLGDYVGRLAQLGIGLHRGVATLVEPSRILTAFEVGKHGMDAFMHTSTLLGGSIVDCRLVILVIRKIGIKAGYGIIAQ